MTDQPEPDKVVRAYELPFEHAKALFAYLHRQEHVQLYLMLQNAQPVFDEDKP